MSWRKSLASAWRSLVALVVAIVLASIAFEAGGFSASGTLKGVVSGAVTGSGSFESTVRYAIPLAFIAIGVVVSFRGGFFNAGAQGQFYVGGIVALTVALFAPASLGEVTISVLAVLAGALAGTLWSVLPGLLRVYFDVNEVIGTLMFSFIAQYLVTWISVGPLKSPAGAGEVAVTRSVPAAVRVTGASGVDAAVLVGVALVAVVTWWLLRRTRFGFGVMLVGRNPVMAEVQGVDMARTGLATFAITGFTAGLAGAIEILGPLGSISSGYDANVGFTAILVALVGVLAVGGSLVAALLFGGLTAAGVYLPIATGLPSTALLFFTGLISFLVTARLGWGRWPKGMAERLRRRPAGPPGAAPGPGAGGSPVEPVEVTT